MEQMELSEESPVVSRLNRPLPLPITPVSTVDRVRNIKKTCLPLLFAGSEDLVGDNLHPFIISCFSRIIFKTI